MQKKKWILIAVSMLSLIVFVLIYNKSRMEAKSKPDIHTSIPVTVVKAEKVKLSEMQSYVGTIAAQKDVAVVSETQGKVVAVYAEVGDYRSAGSMLIQVDDELKHAAYTAAEANYEKAKKDFERFESLRDQNSASDQQYEGAKLAYKSAEAQFVVARRQYEDTKIKTPISGIVTSRTVEVGTTVQSNMVVANVVDISMLKVKLSVPEQEVFSLKTGQGVDIATDVYPGQTFTGIIHTIGSKGDETHMYPVEIEVKNSKEYPLKAGMFGRVTFRSQTDAALLSVPRTALVGSLKKPQVFVVDGQTARLRNLVVGKEIGTSLIVLSGLEEGATVVINGQNNLKDGSSVSITK